MSVDDFDIGPDGYSMADVLEYADVSDERGKVHDYDELCDALTWSESSRQLRRDPKVIRARERLRVAIGPLWCEDDGNSDQGYYSEPNYGYWDELYPIADKRRREMSRALSASAAIRERLRELARVVNNIPTRLQWLPADEPPVPPPSRTSRSKPDLALAPPLPRVALLSDDAMVALAA
jgi:hypothetical protein